MSKNKLYIVKVGGNILDNESVLKDFIEKFASLSHRKILVHGGGKLATELAGRLGIPQTMVEGRRITDTDTLKIVTMVYAGYINKNLVARLQAKDCHAIGLTGADGNLILAHKREGARLDYGFAGDVDEINEVLLKQLIEAGLTPVLAPITHDKKGQLLNTNADTIAQEIAKSLSSEYEVILIYSFEKSGVLLNASDDSSVIQEINPSYFNSLKNENKIFAGMIPKLENAFQALHNGVEKVIIGKAEQLPELVEGKMGTTLTL